eukprot:358403-Chlamydomonas_euryale.AAC.1
MMRAGSGMMRAEQVRPRKVQQRGTVNTSKAGHKAEGKAVQDGEGSSADGMEVEVWAREREMKAWQGDMGAGRGRLGKGTWKQGGAGRKQREEGKRGGGGWPVDRSAGLQHLRAFLWKVTERMGRLPLAAHCNACPVCASVDERLADELLPQHTPTQKTPAGTHPVCASVDERLDELCAVERRIEVGAVATHVADEVAHARTHAWVRVHQQLADMRVDGGSA